MRYYNLTIIGILIITFFSCNGCLYNSDTPEVTRDNPNDEHSVYQNKFVELSFPEDGSTVTDTTIIFEWVKSNNACSYHIQVASDESFSNLVKDKDIASSDNHYTIKNFDYGFYYWRIAIVNCYNVIGSYSEYRTFSVSRKSFSTNRIGYNMVNLNNKIYAIGGMSAYNGGFNDYLNSVESFNTEIFYSPWSLKESGSFLPNKTAFAACASVDGKIFYFGGLKADANSNSLVPSKDIYVFDETSNVWTKSIDLPLELYNFSAAAIGNNIYIAGGLDSTNKPTNVFYKLDTSRSNLTWEKLLDSPLNVHGHRLLSANNIIFLIGGKINDVSYNNKLYSFDVINNKWVYESLHPMLERINFTCEYYNYKIYVIGGEKADSILDSVLIYNTSEISWSSGTPMTTARSYLQSAFINNNIYSNMIYTIGGYDGNNITDKVEIYDLKVNKWY